MIKGIMTWAAALLMVGGVAVGCGYLAYEASPEPIIIIEELIVEKIVEVEVEVEKIVEIEVEKIVIVEVIIERDDHVYADHFYAAIFLKPNGKPVSVQVDASLGFPKDALYLLKISYDYDITIPYTGVTFGLSMPTGYPDIEITLYMKFATNLKVTYERNFEMPEEEDEF